MCRGCERDRGRWPRELVAQHRRLRSGQAGDAHDLAGSAKTIPVTLGKLPGDKQARTEASVQQDKTELSSLGMTLVPSSVVSGASKKGVAVAKVDQDGIAAPKGLSVGDVILEANGKLVLRPSDLKTAFNTASITWPWRRPPARRLRRGLSMEAAPRASRARSFEEPRRRGDPLAAVGQCRSLISADSPTEQMHLGQDPAVVAIVPPSCFVNASTKRASRPDAVRVRHVETHSIVTDNRDNFALAAATDPDASITGRAGGMDVVDRQLTLKQAEDARLDLLRRLAAFEAETNASGAG